MKGRCLLATASSPPPPFRLTHLEIRLRRANDVPVLEKLLLPSKYTLTTLTIRGFGYSQSTAASAVTVFSLPSFPNLRHLVFSSEPSTWAFLELLLFLPSLHSITLETTTSLFRDSFFTTIGNAAPPGLLVLRVKGTDFFVLDDEGASFLISYLWATLDSPHLRNLRQLYLPLVWRTKLSAQKARDLEDGCEERGVYFSFA